MRRPRFVVSAAALAALAFGACSFDGSRDAPPAEADASPDALLPDGPLPDAAPRVTCDASFTKIGLSHYRVVDELLTWNNAISRCRDFQGAHLVTFETLPEITAVTTLPGIVLPAWTAIAQLLGSANPSAGWTNRIGPVQSPAPQPFPWRVTEPNDGGATGNTDEADNENFAELHAGGMFDDAPEGRLSRALCECTPTL
jgi:hypothetical protein